MKDTILYDRLNITPDASVEDIRKAGRKMSMKWHPDKNISNREEAEKKFKEVREAVDILCDPEKRELYHNYGIDFDKREQIPDFNGFPFPFMNKRHETAVEDVIHNISCSLEQIAKEESVTFTYQHKVTCNGCNGEGTMNGNVNLFKQCKRCNGKGMSIQIIQMGPIRQQMSGPCPDCEGKGKMIQESDRCVYCKGNAYVVKKETNSIKLQNGLENGMRIKIDGKGHQLKKGTSDLIIVLHEEPHEAFTRKGPDVYVDIELTLYEALFGFKKIVYHLDGRVLRIQHQGKTNYGTHRVIENQGFVNLRGKGKGNLYLRFIFELPFIENVNEIQPPESLDEDKVDHGRINDVEMYETVIKTNEQNEDDDEVKENPQECRPM